MYSKLKLLKLVRNEVYEDLSITLQRSRCSYDTDACTALRVTLQKLDEEYLNTRRAIVSVLLGTGGDPYLDVAAPEPEVGPHERFLQQPGDP